MNRVTSKLLHQAEGFLDEDLGNFYNTDDSTDDKEWVKVGCDHIFDRIIIIEWDFLVFMVP